MQKPQLQWSHVHSNPDTNWLFRYMAKIDNVMYPMTSQVRTNRDKYSANSVV